MYERNREASALAEIARAIAAGKLQNNSPSTKPSQPTGLEHHKDVPPKVPSEHKKSAPVEANEHLEPQKKKKKQNSDKITSQQQQEVDEIEPPLPSPPQPPQQLLPSTSNAFHDWYLSTLADNFESEIEGLGNDVGSKVLIQALESNLSLFSAKEMKVALTAAGIKTALD